MSRLSIPIDTSEYNLADTIAIYIGYYLGTTYAYVKTAVTLDGEPSNGQLFLRKVFQFAIALGVFGLVWVLFGFEVMILVALASISADLNETREKLAGWV